MPDVKSFMQRILPLLPLIISLAGHFILANFVIVYTGGIEDDSDDDSEDYIWLPYTMIFSHLFLFITGLWTLQDRESVFPVLVFIFVVIVAFFMDVILLRIYFEPFEEANGDGDTKLQRTWQFSAGMMVINLLAKPLTVALAAVAIFFRSGASIPGLNIGGRRSESYQPLPEEN